MSHDISNILFEKEWQDDSVDVDNVINNKSDINYADIRDGTVMMTIFDNDKAN